MTESRLSPGDRELDRALSDLGGYLAYPPTPDLAGGVRRRLANQPTRPRSIWYTLLTQRRLAVALLVLIAAAATIVAVSPAARTAIADRLGLRGVQIQQVTAIPTPLGSRLNLGQPMTLDQARTRAAFAVQVPAVLGAPDEVYLLSVPASGQVALVYHARPTLPQANGTGVGLLLTEFQGSLHSTGVVGKGLPPGTRLEELQVGGGRGYWIDGDPHTFFYLDGGGQVQMETTRLAGGVLLWEQADMTLRLESALPKEAALQIAASVH
jgi:hypothetical protein